MTVYLTRDQIYSMHEQFMKYNLHEGGVRNWGILAHSATAPAEEYGGTPAWKNIYEQAAVYMLIIARFQPFNDGNRRTAFASGVVFLRMNGVKFGAEHEDIPKFMTTVKEGDYDVRQVAALIADHSKTRLPRNFEESFEWFVEKYQDDLHLMADMA